MSSLIASVAVFVGIVLLPFVHSLALEPSGATSGERKIVSLFWREECGHCKREKQFLDGLVRTMPHLEVRGINIDTTEGREWFDAITRRYDLPKVTPITVIGRKPLVGFDKAETTGAEILRLLDQEKADLGLKDLLAAMGERGADEAGTCPVSGPATSCDPSPNQPVYVHLPFLGAIDPTRFTLPVLSLVLGLVDGFNPCAMWVLVAFLTALAQVGSIRKMIQFAGVFLLAQAFMYYLILNSWFLAFNFIQADRVVTPLVGLLAIGGGAFFLWESRHSDGSCRVTNLEQRSRTLGRIGALSRRNLTPVVVLGILGLAFSVNVVEFACSIGIPQAYTKILDLNQVGLLKRQVLMGIYIFMYMFDDLVVFALAIWSIERIGLTTRYTRLSNLVGGIIMILLGGMLMWAPEKLRF